MIDYYKSRAGNPDGIPVVQIGINLQLGQDALTDNFIRQAGYDYVANDTSRVLARRFQASGQPIFAIINGVSNSPSHKQWELLLHQNGYGTTQHPIAQFRRVIDSVKAAAVAIPPRINRIQRLADGSFELTVLIDSTAILQLEATSNLTDWTPITSGTAQGGAVRFLDTQSKGLDLRIYRAVFR